MDNRDRSDIIKLLVVCLTIVILGLGATYACSINQTQVNAIEQVCYKHGGRMQKAPYTDSYMTCVGQTR